MPYKDPQKRKAYNIEYNKRRWQATKNDPILKEKRRQWCRAWEQRNKEKRLRYAREHRVGRNGKIFYVKKRPWTGFCELCGKTIEKNLMYHEFDDKTNGIGIWVCGRCHRYCHGYDHPEYLNKYLELKKLVSAKNGMD